MKKDSIAQIQKRNIRYAGSEYNPEFDKVRLWFQTLKIFNCMKDGQWRTLGEISKLTKAPQASVSAQLRHLRKEVFGCHTVEKRPRGERANGLWEYQLIPNPTYSKFFAEAYNKMLEERKAEMHNKSNVNMILEILDEAAQLKKDAKYASTFPNPTTKQPVGVVQVKELPKPENINPLDNVIDAVVGFFRRFWK